MHIVTSRAQSGHARTEAKGVVIDDISADGDSKNSPDTVPDARLCLTRLAEAGLLEGAAQ